MDDELNLIINSPRLYLINFFDDLRNQIDTEAEIYMAKHKYGVELKEEALQQQVAMINEVDLFQERCLDSLAAKPIEQLSLHQVQNLERDLYARKKMLFMNKGLIFLNMSDLLVRLVQKDQPFHFEIENDDFLRVANFPFGMLVIVEDEFLQYSGKFELSIM